MEAVEAPVLIVGRGPVGMTLGLLLARLGVGSVMVDRLGAEIPFMSKAVVMHRDSAEILGRAGIGAELSASGVALRASRTYYGERELFHAELPAADPGAFPPLLNVPQSETERLLIARVDAEPLIDLRLRATLTSVETTDSGALATLDDDSGGFRVRAEYVAGCDGGRSAVRKHLPIGFAGHTHNDHYLIVDVRAELPLAVERRFWFNPPANPGRTVLIHPQAGDLWHIDFQVGEAPDLEQERRSGRLDQRVRSVIGDVEYEIASITTYVFKQLIADRFSAGAAFIVGDAAHLYAPYGARGLNSGLADADNLAWKLAAVLAGAAPRELLDTYDLERRSVAQTHFRVTSRTAEFMAPTTRRGRLRRDLTLAAAVRFPALRRFVDSGHFYEPLGYPASPIVQPADRAGPAAGPQPGELMPDLPIRALSEGWSACPATNRLRDLIGDDFLLVHVSPGAEAGSAVAAALARTDGGLGDRLRVLTLLPPAASAPRTAAGDGLVAHDHLGAADQRLGGGESRLGSAFLLRPDGHIASRHALSDPPDRAEAEGWLRHALGVRDPSRPA